MLGPRDGSAVGPGTSELGKHIDRDAFKRKLPTMFHCNGVEDNRNLEYDVWSWSCDLADAADPTCKVPVLLVPVAMMVDKHVAKQVFVASQTCLLGNLLSTMKALRPRDMFSVSLGNVSAMASLRARTLPGGAA